MSSSSFLAAFVDFTQDPTAALTDEFERLAIHKGWDPKHKKYHQNRSRFYASEFDHHYGSDATKLENWQSLCIEVEIEPAPPSIAKCKKVESSM